MLKCIDSKDGGKILFDENDNFNSIYMSYLIIKGKNKTLKENIYHIKCNAVVEGHFYAYSTDQKIDKFTEIRPMFKTYCRLDQSFRNTPIIFEIVDEDDVVLDIDFYIGVGFALKKLH